MSNELILLSIHDLSNMIHAKEVSPVEVVESHLAHIEALEPQINAFITVSADEARDAAKTAEEEMMGGKSRGPLHGIPFGVKDIIDTQGVLTTQGSSFFPENTPATDACCVRRLKEAGAILIGKCNTHEFAAGSTTKNPHHGACRNPWDSDRVPGGSSGGSGASVAAFMCPGAIGTDTGGSIRGPASVCGVVGLKPTYGRVSLQGIFPNAPSLDHAGPLARSAADCAHLLQAMAGYDPSDTASADVPVPDFCADIGEGVEGMRFGICRDLHMAEVDGAVQDAYENALEVFRRLGGRVEFIDFPHAGKLQEARQVIAHAELISVHRERLLAHPEKFGEDLRARLQEASGTSLDDYIRALRDKIRLTREFNKLFDGVDALLVPGYPCVAAPIETTMAKVNGRDAPFSGLGRPLLGPYNFTGAPAVAVPTGRSTEGLPVAMQIVGPHWAEAPILRAAHAYEEATPELRGLRPQALKGV